MLAKHNEVIDYIGLRGAFPALRGPDQEPAILRPGDDESGTRRVAWPEFFQAIERRHLVLVCGDSPSLDFHFLPKRAAMKELGVKRRQLARHSLEEHGLPALLHHAPA